MRLSTHPVSWGVRVVTAGLTRQIACDNARMARAIARIGEPHAKARGRILEMQERMHRAIEHEAIHGRPRS